MSKVFSSDELEEIFSARETDKVSEWNMIKENFYDVGLENILSEDIGGLMFHMLYLKVISFTDREILDCLLEEI